MAGAFAHMCVVDSLGRTPGLLASAGRPGLNAANAIKEFGNFCELGAVSPDCSFLDYRNANSTGWGNAMHYWNTADIVRRGVSFFAGKNLENPDVARALAWLFGYCAHVVTDLTVHPILADSGYPYAANPKEHRRCELHQDAYIFYELHHVEAVESCAIDNCGIATCADPNDPEKLHPAIRELWLYCLDDIAPSKVFLKNGEPGPTAPPTPDIWFHEYVKRLSFWVEQGGGFPLFFRKLVECEAVFLRRSSDVYPEYIHKLKTATKPKIDYKTVFDMAKANVLTCWEELGRAIAAGNQRLLAMKNSNLDTGEADDGSGQIYIA